MNWPPLKVNVRWFRSPNHWRKYTYLQQHRNKLRFPSRGELCTFLGATRDNSLQRERSRRDAGKWLEETILSLKDLLLDAWRLQTTSNFATPRIRYRKAKCLLDDKRAKGHVNAPAILDSHFLVPRVSLMVDDWQSSCFPLITRNEDS